MISKKYILRALFTILLVAIAYVCFTFPPPRATETIQIDSQRTVSTELNNGSKFFEWIGLLSLGFSVWIWRKELKLTGFGPFSGPPIEQQSPEMYRREVMREEKEASKAQSTLEVDVSNMREEELHQQKERILDLAKKSHALNVMAVAHDLRISRQSAKALLFLLIKEGKLRCDGYPNATLYTLTSSLENLAIDRIKSLIREHHLIRTERRFIRVRRRYELDAVLESGEETFLIEIKFLRSLLNIPLLATWMASFLRVAKEFGDNKASCYLVIVAFEGVSQTETQELISKVSYDFGNKPVRVVVLDKNDLIASTTAIEQSK